MVGGTSSEVPPICFWACVLASVARWDKLTANRGGAETRSQDAEKRKRFLPLFFSFGPAYKRPPIRDIRANYASHHQSAQVAPERRISTASRHSQSRLRRACDSGHALVSAS